MENSLFTSVFRSGRKSSQPLAAETANVKANVRPMDVVGQRRPKTQQKINQPPSAKTAAPIRNACA